MATDQTVLAPSEAVDDEVEVEADADAEAYVSPTVDFLLVLAVAIQFAVLGVALLVP